MLGDIVLWCIYQAYACLFGCYQGGMYVFNLFDIQSGGISLLFIGFCEAAVIGWGVGKFTLRKVRDVYPASPKLKARFLLIDYQTFFISRFFLI